jgi:hypothetical protein
MQAHTTIRSAFNTKVAAGDFETISILKSISPVPWRNVNLIGNFDLTTSSSSVRDIETLAASYQAETCRCNKRHFKLTERKVLMGRLAVFVVLLTNSDTAASSGPEFHFPR